MLENIDLLTLFLKHPSVCTDSRKLNKGDIFFALKGQNFNGNQFALQAIENGASYAVIDEKVTIDQNAEEQNKLIFVSNTLTSLQKLANDYRNYLNIPVIGLTGSNGKTTTKELIAEVLNCQFKINFTKGNLNNEIGVPLTILNTKADDEMLVVEMGANHQGEIALLSEIANPNFGIITNIGKAHLEGFGGEEGVKKGKSELFRHLAK
ncbi:MAG: UDP-N-acetylmuramoyl-tripeptide--D-alanyl-D-alanine ligase, partial [Bacteroidota bacterium]